MIDGITVLYQEAIIENAAWAQKTISIFALIGIVCFFCCLLSYHNDMLCGIFGIGLLLCLVGGIITNSIAPKEPTGKYEYKVTIDDTVSMTEFYEKYKVIDQEGEIWTIRDK